MADTAHPGAEVDENTAGFWMGVSWKIRQEWGFTAERGRSREALDEEKPLIHGGGAFGYHPEMGGYPDLSDHLFGMNITADKFVSEARARIIWGESFSSVRAFLVSNGLSDADADAKIQEFVLERNREIRSMGIRSVLVGVLLAASAGGVLYWIATWILPPGAARVYGLGGSSIVTGVIVLAAIALYGLWRLLKGIVYLVYPQSVHKSIPDISE